MLAFKLACRQYHLGDLRLPPTYMRKSRLQWTPLADLNTIAIRSIDRAKPAVKPIWPNPSVDNRKVIRQHLVQNHRPTRRLDRNRAIKVADLAQGVGAAIRSTCSNDLVILARDPANSFFQCSLNTSLSRLCGPAAEIGSVVLNDELYSFSQPTEAGLVVRRRRVGCLS